MVNHQDANDVAGREPVMYPDDEISLRELWDIVWGGRWLIIGLTAVATVAGVAYALYATPIYRADTLLMPADEDGRSSASLMGQFGGLAALAGVQLPSGGGSNKTEAIELLKSRVFVDAFISDHGLLPVLYADSWDAERSEWATEPAQTPPSLRMAYERWTSSIMRVSEDKKTGMVTVAIEWTDRVQAAEWVRLLVDRLNATMRARAIEEAERSLQYLHKELERTSVVEVQQAIYRLIEQQVKSIMLANTRVEYVFRTIDPPTVPDENQRIRPKRTSIALLSLMGGGLVGLLLVFMRHAIRGPQSDNLPALESEARR